MPRGELEQGRGRVELRGGGAGREEVEGNVFLEGRPVCDDEWGEEEAAVVCRCNRAVRVEVLEEVVVEL